MLLAVGMRESLLPYSQLVQCESLHNSKGFDNDQWVDLLYLTKYCCKEYSNSSCILHQSIQFVQCFLYTAWYSTVVHEVAGNVRPCCYTDHKKANLCLCVKWFAGKDVSDQKLATMKDVIVHISIGACSYKAAYFKHLVMSCEAL